MRWVERLAASLQRTSGLQCLFCNYERAATIYARIATCDATSWSSRCLLDYMLKLGRYWHIALLLLDNSCKDIYGILPFLASVHIRDHPFIPSIHTIGNYQCLWVPNSVQQYSQRLLNVWLIVTIGVFEKIYNGTLASNEENQLIWYTLVITYLHEWCYCNTQKWCQYRDDLATTSLPYQTLCRGKVLWCIVLCVASWSVVVS